MQKPAGLAGIRVDGCSYDLTHAVANLLRGIGFSKVEARVETPFVTKEDPRWDLIRRSLDVVVGQDENASVT